MFFILPQYLIFFFFFLHFLLKIALVCNQLCNCVHKLHLVVVNRTTCSLVVYIFGQFVNTVAQFVNIVVATCIEAIGCIVSFSVTIFPPLYLVYKEQGKLIINTRNSFHNSCLLLCISLFSVLSNPPLQNLRFVDEFQHGIRAQRINSLWYSLNFLRPFPLVLSRESNRFFHLCSFLILALLFLF